VNELLDRTTTTATGCIEWAGPRKIKDGVRTYGLVQWDGRLRQAHRVAWELARGPIPEALFVCHRCDNPPCINVDHLFLGTNQENQVDSMAKGRAAIGEKQPAAKLTTTAIGEIRAAHAAGESHRTIAARYGVNHRLIGRILKGERWPGVA